jgi:hypothetical protein
VQSKQTPLVPHAFEAVPLAHVPLPQQPPLHDSGAEHVAPQVCELALHACPLGQSEGPLHPHAPAMHACPAAAPVQSTQLPPGAPHAVVAVPSWQPPF